MDSEKKQPASYSQFACVGTGFSAIGLGATLKRWYNIDDVVFFEQESKLGGTWFINQYPGMMTQLLSSLEYPARPGMITDDNTS